MNAELLEIKSRREALLAETAEQRRTFATAWEAIQRPLFQGRQAVLKMSSPWIWIGIGLVAFKLPIRKFSRIPVLLWKGWNLARRVHAMIR